MTIVASWEAPRTMLTTGTRDEAEAEATFHELYVRSETGLGAEEVEREEELVGAR